MATIQEAAQSAVAFARETLGSDRVQNLLLEEIESGSEGGEEVWRITLSMPERNPIGALNAALFSRREYKTFTVLKRTGEVTSMKIREISPN